MIPLSRFGGNLNLMAPTAQQSQLSKILGDLFVMGTLAASIFVKNPQHQQTAANIIDILGKILPDLEGHIGVPATVVSAPEPVSLVAPVAQVSGVQ